ncbi:hypothetical protein JTE90_022554 [Oedothorax gibbosus]|uniref:Uncharacterized protein n=1 Tax=Oedothorax gibbosus TaxID=931172 RepID=A0AAV6UVZ7_9ARAC|nr:hypothetical protein JTE90_022554 [Oedothorax gibbosus]
MTTGIVVLKVTGVQPVKLPQRRKHVVVQNSAVGIGVELTMNGDQRSQSIPGETPPDHNSTSAELDCWHNTFWQETFSRQTPDPGPAIRTVKGEP